jgi:hypothetical protein
MQVEGGWGLGALIAFPMHGTGLFTRNVEGGD